MNPILLITQNAVWIIIVVIIVFLIYKLKNIFCSRKNKEQQIKDDNLEIIKKSVTEEEQKEAKESTLKRMKRGFGVMKDKLRNSEYIQNLQKEDTQQDFGLQSLMTEKESEDFFKTSFQI